MYWYHKDALGSIYQMTDDAETVVRTYDYAAFGTIDSETGTGANPFTYTGREYDDDSGLYYYRARYYDTSVGRFLSRDPIGIRGGINLYLYVLNNPINLVDPSGEFIAEIIQFFCALAIILEEDTKPSDPLAFSKHCKVGCRLNSECFIDFNNILTLAILWEIAGFAHDSIQDIVATLNGASVCIVGLKYKGVSCEECCNCLYMS